ncbi:hypothetical protein C8J56DRAFT_903047 [Mycena floridula]|nr:hypothetical protein C8J56DRAFT_903047 [Mycena floridula]
MVRPRLYKSTKERKEAHNQASIRYYARYNLHKCSSVSFLIFPLFSNHDRISAELRAQRLKQKHKRLHWSIREKAEKRQRDKRARKTENVLEAVIEAHKPDKISQWMRLAAALPRQIHRAMTPNPDSHMNRLLDDLSKPQIDTVGIERTLKRLGELRTKANSFWSPIVALEGTVDSPAFKRYLGFQGQVVKAIAWVENLYLASMEGQDMQKMRDHGDFLYQKEKGMLLQVKKTWQTVIGFSPDYIHNLSQAASTFLPLLDPGTKLTPFLWQQPGSMGNLRKLIPGEHQRLLKAGSPYGILFAGDSNGNLSGSLSTWQFGPDYRSSDVSSKPHVRGFQEKPWAKAYCRWVPFTLILVENQCSTKGQFVYSKDPSLGTGPLVYLDHSPSFAALNCEDENTVCDLYAATYIQGILFGSYQQTMQAIYDDFLFRYPQYRLGPLFGIDIMLVSNETMIRRGQHIDFLADYLWHYCNDVEPGFRAAGLVRLMHQWHRDYPGAFSIWIDGQAHISPREEEAWRLSLFMQRWYLDYPGALGRWIDGNSDITRQAEEAWDEAHSIDQ